MSFKPFNGAVPFADNADTPPRKPVGPLHPRTDTSDTSDIGDTNAAGTVAAQPESGAGVQNVPLATGLEDLFAPVAAPTAEANITQPLAPAVGAGRLASMQAAAQEASLSDQGEVDEVEMQRQAAAIIAEQQRLFVHIDRILGIVSSDVHLSGMATQFELARDPAIDARQRNDLQNRVAPLLLENNVYLDNLDETNRIFDLLYDELLGISVLGDLWRDDDVSEICIDSWDKITVERHGRLEMTGRRFRSPEHAEGVVRALSRRMSDRQVSPTNPLVTAQLPSARVQFVYGKLSSRNVAVTIRKFKPLMGMAGLLGVDALSDEMADFLRACVQGRSTILVSGGTGTGKTTMINALSEFIPDDERVITIEDAFELQLSNTHWVALQAKERASADDTVVVTQADLMIATLRMRPDRIIVGEIRDPAAAAVMFDAASTGHDGTMTTIHADTAASALNKRLTALLMRSDGGFSENVAVHTVAQTVQVVVQITRKHGRRFISEISVVDEAYLDKLGLVAPQPIFQSTVNATAADGIHNVSVTHERVSSLGPDTVLAVKLADAGQEVQRWLT